MRTEPQLSEATTPLVKLGTVARHATSATPSKLVAHCVINGGAVSSTATIWLQLLLQPVPLSATEHINVKLPAAPVLTVTVALVVEPIMLLLPEMDQL